MKGNDLCYKSCRSQWKFADYSVILWNTLQAGSTAVWDLSVIGWDISYGVEFAPTATDSYHSIIEKTRKIVSVEEPIRTTFKCVEPGKLVLSIDNTASRKKKLVVYRFKVTAAPGAVVTTAEL
jgi:hypothetical protein